MKRRELLKSLVGLPVLGVFFQQFLQKQSFREDKKQQLLKELDLNDLLVEKSSRNISSGKKDLVRIGLIGFGKRGQALGRGLGFAHPDWIEKKTKSAEQNRMNTRIYEWFEQENMNVAITGICDVFEQRREKGLIVAQNKTRPAGDKRKLPPTKVFGDYRELLADKNIDAVIIATPDHWHAPITIEAVKAGKHVYCEKCMTRTEDEVYQVEKAVKESGMVLQVGYQYHQSAAFEKARDVIAKNILGKITLIESTINRNSEEEAWIRHLDENGKPKPGNPQTIDWNLWLGKRPKVTFSLDRFYNWTKWWDYGTGLVGQLFGHEYDAVNNLLHLGIPSSCVASGGIYFYKDNREIPDIFNAVYEFDDDELSLLFSATLENSRSRGRVFMGHDASMELDSSLNLKIDEKSTRYKDKIERGLIDPSQPAFVFNPGMENVDAITSASERYYAQRGLTYTYRDGKKIDLTYLHLKEWIDCIRNGGEPSVGIKQAMEATIACHMATKSYREKRRVTWDPVKRRIV